MEANLLHEDLLIKLRALLNEEKIKLWEPPYISSDESPNQSLKELAAKYSTSLTINVETVLNALKELQTHSLDRSKANAEFNETGLATFRVKATISGEKPHMFKIQRLLSVLGSEIIAAVAAEMKVSETRIKVIFNGKVVKTTSTLGEQGLKNGALMMALVMTESPEESRQEDTMYMEMKQTREDAMLLSESTEDFAGDQEYMKLEDQNGKTVELPAAERRSLLVGLALHEKGRACAAKDDYSLALVILLEADRLLSECRSSILSTVDNWAVLQLDIAWCYLRLAALPAAGDAAPRLAAAQRHMQASYGHNQERLVALKGTAANERVLFMRLYLMQGILAYHQNRRAEAKQLLEKAEHEIEILRVDPEAVSALMELGWSAGAARAGLRAAGGEPTRAHNYLADRQAHRDRHRASHQADRQSRALGVCADGSAVSAPLVRALAEMGHARRAAARALRRSNNRAAEAVRLLQDQPETLVESGDSSDGLSSASSRDSLIEADPTLVEELVGMGYAEAEARAALQQAWNHAPAAVGLLVAAGGRRAAAAAADNADGADAGAGAGPSRAPKSKKTKKRRAREAALRRLTAAIRGDADEYLDSSLSEEEQYLAQYKSLL